MKVSGAVAACLTFTGLVERVHAGVAAALAHADVPAMQVQAELARRQQLLAFNAIPYQVCLPLHNVTQTLLLVLL